MQKKGNEKKEKLGDRGEDKRRVTWSRVLALLYVMGIRFESAGWQKMANRFMGYKSASVHERKRTSERVIRSTEEVYTRASTVKTTFYAKG